MVHVKFFGCLLLACLLVVGSSAKADLRAALSITDGRVSSFYLAIGDHYQVPEKQIILVKKKEIPDDQLAVVFYLARRANVTPAVILDLRLDGKTWMEITTHFRLTAEIFYVDIQKVSGPPYGKAHGYFKNKKRKEWASIRLADVDIVNLVNLRFVSEHWGYSPDEIVKMREQGQSFIAISDKVKKEKAAKKDKKTNNSDKTGSKGKGKK
ncbi:MAG: hypothetical protein JSV52_05695 [Candidatus Zixiibacteriota bacterium]|nr:MAG: hypothetical protein JSV52_05695 [candidate division Zixibacteria bacterium]